MRKLPIVPGARKIHRTYSFNAMALNTAILSTWAALPDDMKATIPLKWVLGAAIVVSVLGIIGRYIDQPKVHE